MIQKIINAAQILESSSYALALTGANLAKDAGIPNFRQTQLSSCSQGCQHQDCTGSCSEAEFTLENLKNKPENIYRVCFALLQAISQAKPTRGYQILANLEQMKIVRKVLTENVDSLHQVAGTQNILELYGNMRGATCQNCSERVGVPTLVKKIQEKEMPPKCSHCGRTLKPNLVFNDENLPRDFQIAQEEIQKADLLLVIGSNLDLPASRYLANQAAKLIILNPDPTPLDNKAEIVIQGNLEETLASLWEKTQEELGLL